MLTFISKIIKTMFLVFIMLVAMPSLIFLIKSYYSSLVTKKTYIGIIEIPNYITKSNEIIESAKTLFKSPQIKAVIIKFDGQGGNPGACEAVYDDLINLKKSYQKPLVAYCENSCSFGSYIIAAAADTIITNSSTLIQGFGLFNDKPEEMNITSKKHQENTYWEIVNNSRKNRTPLTLSFDRCLTGKEALKEGFVDYLGGTCEIERILRSKAVIEAQIEEVHGSLLEHFILSITHVLNYTFRIIKQAWINA